MSLVAALVGGGAVGVGHALEADHLAAVATLVDERRGADSSGLVGASWGVGHSIPVVALGALFAALGVRLPENVTALFELLVGAVVIALGARMLVVTLGGTIGDSDRGGGRRAHHAHPGIGPLDLGVHRRLDGDSLVVGLVHGVAGSGVLVVAMASTAPTTGTALVFLASFSALSILTMSAVSLAWRRTLAAGATTYLEVAAGLAALVVGGILLIEGSTAAGVDLAVA
jgi:hypothetical protein